MSFLKAAISFEVILTIRISARRNASVDSSSCLMSTMNGLALTALMASMRCGERVDALTRWPRFTSCLAKGNPSQPLPSMLMVFMSVVWVCW